MIHPLADVKTQKIGEGTRIWQFCVVLKQAKIGRYCNICAHVLIENDVLIGDRVTVKNGVQLWDGITIGDDVLIAPNVTFTNDLYPRSKNKHFPECLVRTVVEKGASIGANSTILAGANIGKYALIGAGAVVIKSIPDYAKVVGNPATLIGWVCKCSKTLDVKDEGDVAECCGVNYIKINGVVEIKNAY